MTPNPLEWGLNRSESLFVASLLKANGPVNGFDLRLAIWGDDPPSDISNNLRVIACGARHKLRRYGIVIECIRRHGYALRYEGEKAA